MTLLPIDPLPPHVRPFQTEAHVMLDAEGLLAFWSASAREVFGYRDDEILGRPLADLVPELASDDVAPRGTTGVRKDGSAFPADVLLEQWSGEDTDLASVRIVDIQSRQAWDAAFQDVYVTLTSLLASCASFDEAAPRVVAALVHTLGFTGGAMRLESDEHPRAEWGGRDIVSLTFPVLDGAIDIGALEFFAARHREPDSALRKLMHNVGALIGMFIVRDRALTAVLESEEKYRRLVRTFDEAQAFAHVGSFEWDLIAGTITISDEMAHLFGVPPQTDPLPIDVWRSMINVHNRGDAYAAFEGAIASGEPLDVNLSLTRRSDGSERVVRIRARAVLQGGVAMRLLGNVLDVTADDIALRERLALQQELEDARRMVSLGRLAATMAHEFNNVLIGVSSFATHLLRRANDDESRRAATHILDVLRRGKSITDEILRYTRASEPLLSTISVREWLESYLPEAFAVTGGRTEVEVGEELYVHGDLGQLNQVLSNLVLNARDASPSGEPITISAKRTIEHGSPAVELIVADRGTGIPAEIRDRVFEPLFTTKRSGTGLGLAVVHQVVRAHGGTIRVRSEIGRGTAFHILLPLADPPPVREATMPDSMSILLADDNEAFAIGTTALLDMEGIETRVVGRGKDIIPAIQQQMPDALILDVGLPDVNGTDVYQTIASRWPRLPVIFVSGHYRAAHVEQLLVQPHVAFLEKPFEVERLLEALERVVAAA